MVVQEIGICDSHCRWRVDGAAHVVVSNGNSSCVATVRSIDNAPPCIVHKGGVVDAHRNGVENVKNSIREESTVARCSDISCSRPPTTALTEH